MLSFGIEWRPNGAAERVRGGHDAWHFHVHRVMPEGPDEYGDRRDASGLNSSCDVSHGHVADRSSAHKEQCIDSVLPERFDP